MTGVGISEKVRLFIAAIGFCLIFLATIGCNKRNLVVAQQDRMRSIRVASEMHFLSQNRYPKNSTDLMQMDSELELRDVWDNDLKINYSVVSVVVVSAGPDGKFSTVDDIKIVVGETGGYGDKFNKGE